MQEKHINILLAVLMLSVTVDSYIHDSFWSCFVSFVLLLGQVKRLNELYK